MSISLAAHENCTAHRPLVQPSDGDSNVFPKLRNPLIICARELKELVCSYPQHCGFIQLLENAELFYRALSVARHIPGDLHSPARESKVGASAFQQVSGALPALIPLLQV